MASQLETHSAEMKIGGTGNEDRKAVVPGWD
jgi:hypothetical protein